MISTISYIAGGGGNHLKNIISLDSSFANSADLNLSVYFDQPAEPAGTVHSIPGRNIRPDIVEGMIRTPQKNWLLHGHWGELMPYRYKLNHANNRWLLLTLDHADDRALIQSRHDRLQQHPHPYWLDEEQPYLYQPEMYQYYFNAQPHNIFQLSVVEFWHPDLTANNVIEKINGFLGTNIDVGQAQKLHEKWWKMNFNFDWNCRVRDFYNRI